MYKFNQNAQMSLYDFNLPIGLKMNPDNRWIKKAETIPWDAIEERYAKLFPSNTGVPAKPLRMALGSLLIQKQLGFSDRELVEEITENPYLQYFVGLPGYQTEADGLPGTCSVCFVSVPDFSRRSSNLSPFLSPPRMSISPMA